MRAIHSQAFHWLHFGKWNILRWEQRAKDSCCLPGSRGWDCQGTEHLGQVRAAWQIGPINLPLWSWPQSSNPHSLVQPQVLHSDLSSFSCFRSLSAPKRFWSTPRFLCLIAASTYQWIPDLTSLPRLDRVHLHPRRLSVIPLPCCVRSCASKKVGVSNFGISTHNAEMPPILFGICCTGLSTETSAWGLLETLVKGGWLLPTQTMQNHFTSTARVSVGTQRLPNPSLTPPRCLTCVSAVICHMMEEDIRAKHARFFK